MNVLLAVLFLAGCVIMVVTSVLLLSQAFRKSILWGLAYLFVPIASIVFLVKYWEESKRTFYVMIGGFLIVAAAVGIDIVRTPDRPPVPGIADGSSTGDDERLRALLEAEKTSAARTLTPPARRTTELSAIRTAYRGTVETRLLGRVRIAP